MDTTRNVAAPRGMRARLRHFLPFIRWAPLLAPLALANGCSSYGFGARVSDEPPPEAAAPKTQIERGEQLFADSCAGCHGDRGEGLEGRPAIAGKGALPLDPPEGAKSRTAQFKTALDLFQFLKSDMPPIAPGSLSDEQYFAIVAFQLKESGVDYGKGDIDEKRAASIPLRP